MNWKNRQLFSNREQGIMSGLDPIPMMGGGSVPYPGMQTGGMVGMDLFEEGDQDVNEALNMMATVANPEVPDMPATNGAAPMMEETVEVTETITEDQGPEGYKAEVESLKNNFKEEIRTYVSQGGTDNIEAYLKDMGRLYRSKLSELKEKYRVTEYSPDEELITKEFLAEIIPGMEDAGVVYSAQQIEEAKQILDSLGINLTPQQFLGMPKEQQEEFKNIFLVQTAQMPEAPTSEVSGISNNLMKLLKERRGLSEEIGEAARSGYASIGSTGGHFLGARSAGRKAELSARDAALADEIGLYKDLLAAQARGTGSGGVKLTEWQRNRLSGRPDDVSGLDDEFYEEAYTDLLKPDPYSGNFPTALDALTTFVSLYRQVPPSRVPEFQGKKDVGGVGMPKSFQEFIADLYRKDPELTRDKLKTSIIAWLKAQPAT